MKHKIILLVFIVTSLNFVVKAQNIDFDLKSYKTTDYERSSLNLDFDLGESFSSVNSGYDYSDDSFDNSRINKTGRANINLGSEFNKIIQSTSKIVNYGSSLSLNDSYQRGSSQRIDLDTTSDFSRIFQGDYNLSGYYHLDYYYSNNLKSYLLLGGATSLGFLQVNNKYEKNDILNEDPYTKNGSSIYASVSLGHGHGRVEQVEDAVEALYILHELNANGQLNKAINENDVKILADKITYLKKERYFDSRIQRQKTMKELIGLLSENGIIEEENIEVYNTIADYHYFAGIQTRSSGKKFSYYLSPRVDLDETNVSNEDYTQNLDLVFSGNLYFVDYKPVSVKWQRNFNGSVSVQRIWEKDADYVKEIDVKNELESRSDYVYSTISYAIGYYPSTRSYIDASCYANLQYRFINDDQSTTWMTNVGLNVSGYYYFSERVRLSLSGRLQLYGNKSDYNRDEETQNYSRNSNQFHQSLSMSLQYFLF